MDIICIEESAFFVLIEHVITGIRANAPAKEDKWISTAEAMKLLRITSPTTLQKLRDEKKIRATQPGTRTVLYDRDSILDYLEDFAYETF